MKVGMSMVIQAYRERNFVTPTMERQITTTELARFQSVTQVVIFSLLFYRRRKSDFING